MSIVAPPEPADPTDIVKVDSKQGARRRMLRNFFAELWQDKAALLGFIYLVVLVIGAFLAPLLAPYDPAAQSLGDRLLPPFWMDGGGTDHILGTDNLGRDVLSRLIFGARISLLVGTSVVVFAGAVGVVAGLFAGYKGGRTDSVIMRMVDTQVAFPGLLLALMILAVIGPSVGTVILVLSLNGWMVYARVTRGSVLSVKERPYVEAAELVGAKQKRVVFRHILPGLTAPLITLVILEFARVILAEAALSFLGLGIQPPETSWGLDVATGKDYIFRAPWLIIFPGIAIALTVLSANMIASWLRVRTNPLARAKRFAEVTASKDRPTTKEAAS
ncbi:MAG: ABC transporter permease [Acidimicrobiia bacterium]